MAAESLWSNLTFCLPAHTNSIYRYFHKFEEAEARYLRMQREDLARQLRYKLGDWFRVVKLMNTAGSTTDVKGHSAARDCIAFFFCSPPI